MNLCRFHAKTVCSASSISSLHYEGKALAKQGCEPMNIIKGLVFLIYTRWVTMACYTVAAIERADFYTSAKKVFETVLASPIKFVVMIIVSGRLFYETNLKKKIKISIFCGKMR